MHYKDNNFSLHTHTKGFDGRNSVREMVEQAKNLGLDAIGISNHFIVHPVIKQTEMYKYALRDGYAPIYSANFSEVMRRFVPHYEEVRQVREENPNIKVWLGMEVDFFNSPQWIAGFQHCINILKPDYIIGSAHFVEYGGTLLNSHDWKSEKYQAVREILLQRYWQNISLAAESGLFTWMAHLDLPKKVGLGREDKWIKYEEMATDSIAKSKIGMEINNSGFGTRMCEQYPSERILKMAADKKIPVLISDDAHGKETICCDFEKSKDLMRRLKLSQFELIK